MFVTILFPRSRFECHCDDPPILLLIGAARVFRINREPKKNVDFHHVAAFITVLVAVLFVGHAPDDFATRLHQTFNRLSPIGIVTQLPRAHCIPLSIS